jgi:hypothetical protein
VGGVTESVARLGLHVNTLRCLPCRATDLFDLPDGPRP